MGGEVGLVLTGSAWLEYCILMTLNGWLTFSTCSVE